MEDLKQADINFGFLFDIRKLGLISMNYMKEFTELMASNAPLLESKLYASFAVAQGTLLKSIFGIINTFYKTKKPLKIVDNMEDGFKFIDENLF